MQSYFLKQPNGKLVVFSDEVSRFTFYNLSEREALEYGSARWGQETAEAMIASAIEDRPVEGSRATDGLSRWQSALTTIAARHGIDGIRKALSEIGIPDADIPQAALDVALDFAGHYSPLNPGHP